MSNVIGFPPRDPEQAKSDEVRLAALSARADALRTMLMTNKTIPPADQMTVAEALWRLLARLQDRGISKTKILETAGVARRHLGQYARNPDRRTDERGTTRPLTKKPRPYLKIIEAAATEAGVVSDDVLLEVFGATSLATSVATRTAAPEFIELTGHLQDIAKAVAEKHGLQEYFNDVVRSGNELLVSNQAQETHWDKLAPENVELRFHKNRTHLDWPINYWTRCYDALFHDHGKSVPPYPAIILGEWSIGDGYSFHWALSHDPRNQRNEKWSFANSFILSQYTAELRLCIVPVGPELRPEVALRLKIGAQLPTVAIQAGDQHDIITFEGLDWVPTQEPKDINARRNSNGSLIICQLWSGGRILRLSERQNKESDNTSRLVKGQDEALPPLIERYFPPNRTGERFACQFVPLTGRVAEDWFSLPAYDFGLQDWHPTQVPAHVRVLGAPLFRNITADDFSPFNSGTIAAGLDLCVTGRAGQNPLDLFDGRAAQFVRAFREASAAANAERNRGVARLAARLREISGEKRPPK